MTLNTIIEEEKKEFEGAFMNNGINWVLDDKFQDPKMLLIRTHFITAMQRAYEAGEEERDTYWKERVEEEREKTRDWAEVSYKRGYENGRQSIFAKNGVIELRDVDYSKPTTEFTPITKDNLK